MGENVHDGSDVYRRVIGVFYEVYNELGYGFAEVVYHRALARALMQAGLQAISEVPVPVSFRGEVVGVFKADLVVDDRVVLELKVADGISKAHEAQLIHYLRASKYEVGLVLNFGESPRFKKVEFGNERKVGLARDEAVAVRMGG